MKKTIFMAAFFAFFNSIAFAVECPKIKLNCEHKVLDGKTYYYKTVESKTAEFIAINDDEPSEPINKCDVSLSFKSYRSKRNLNVHVNEDMHTYFYVGINNGAHDPQFELDADLNKEMTLSLIDEKMVCTINLD